MKRFLSTWLLLIFGLAANFCQADTFGSGLNSFDIEFVPIGQPGNARDDPPNPAGAVAYSYRMGKYEISEQMVDKANMLGGLGITKDTRGPDKPATSVTWYEAAQFVNWLNTSKDHTPAYKFDTAGVFQLWQPTDPGYDEDNLFRNTRARYFLPSIHEWHKAAYYDPAAGVYYDYPTGTDTIPDGIDFVGDLDFEAVFDDGDMNPQPNDVTDVGLLSPYGTAGQGGNALEWHETAFDRVNDIAAEQRSIQGGGWVSTHTVLAAWNTGIGTTPQFDASPLGFRITSIPEPTSAVFIGSVLAVIFGFSRRISGLMEFSQIHL